MSSTNSFKYAPPLDASQSSDFFLYWNEASPDRPCPACGAKSFCRVGPRGHAACYVEPTDEEYGVRAEAGGAEAAIYIHRPKSAREVEAERRVQVQADEEFWADKEYRFLTLNDLAYEPPPYWLVGGDLVPGGGVVTLAGFTGTGKTFTALDLSMSVATGRPWLGEETCGPSPVIFVPLEGRQYLKDRVDSWTDYHDVSDDGRFHVVLPRDGILDLGREDEEGLVRSSPFRVLERAIERADARLLVIDPIYRALGRVNELDASAMRPIMLGLGRVAANTGATILIVAHTGWEKSHERLSSAVRGETDLTMNLRQEKGGGLLLRCDKLRPAEEWQDRRLLLHQHGPAALVVPRGADTEKRAAVLDVLGKAGAPLSQNDLAGRVGGNKRRTVEVIRELVALRKVNETDGPNNSKLYSLAA